LSPLRQPFFYALQEKSHMTEIVQQKEKLRRLLAPNPQSMGTVAEILRRQSIYRQANVVYVAPSPALLQIRINCLVDGKTLLSATAGLKKGFYCLKPFTVPFGQLSFAVTAKGMQQFGMVLKDDAVKKYQTDLLIAEALAVDTDGNRLGDGNGFFDLACAFLNARGGLKMPFNVVAITDYLSQEPIPPQPWDIPIHYAVVDREVVQLTESQVVPTIFWDALPEKKIRKIDFLWKLYKKGR